MKVLYWITFSTLLLTSVIAICSCVSLARKPRDVVLRAPGAGTGKSQGGGAAVVELCRRGLVLLGQDENASADSSDTTENGGAMVQSAWAHQSRHPAVVPKIWVMTEDWAATLPLDRRYLTLALYLESVNDAIDSCERPDDFDLLWQVRMQITSRIDEVEQNRISTLSRDLEKLVKEVDDKGVEQCLLSPDSSKNLEDIRARLETLSESSDESPKVIGDQLQAIGKALSSLFGNRIVDLEKRYATEKQHDANVDSKIAPAIVDGKHVQKKGEYTQLLHEVEGVWTKRMSTEAQYWMQFTTNATSSAAVEPLPDAESVKSRSLDQRLQELRSGIMRSVRIRYNMWAVKQIYQASTIAGPRGCTALGRIDNGLLDPSVSALYSMAESQVFQSIDDPSQRHIQVRKMLLTEPVRLDAF